MMSSGATDDFAEAIVSSGLEQVSGAYCENTFYTVTQELAVKAVWSKTRKFTLSAET
jgi:hypothetical protein